MINLGNITIKDLRLGASQVKAAYLGNQQIWGGGSPTPPGPTPVLPTQDLKLHFDAIDNAGVGNHLASTKDWANIAPDTSADYKLHRTTGTWEDDSAVFTGAYNECFWLQDIGGTQIDNLFSSLNMLSSSWTYAIGLYYNPATIESYRGYIGKQQSATSLAQIYLRTDLQVSWLLFGYKQGGASTRSQDSYFEGHAPDFKDSLTQNAFNTMVGTWDAATATFKVYVNGQLEFTWPSPGGAAMLGHELPLTLGGGVQQSGSNRVCKGKIHDFLVYSRALSDVEVAQLHGYQDARFNS